MLRGAHIGVVIAGDDGDMLGRSDTFQPRTGRCEFRLQRDVDEIAGDGDVVGPLRLQVLNQRVQHLAPMNLVPVARPVQIAERAFAGEVAPAAAPAAAQDADRTNAPA